MLLLRPLHFRPCSWRPLSTGMYHDVLHVRDGRAGRWHRLGPLRSHPIFTKWTSPPQNKAPLQPAAQHIGTERCFRNSSNSSAQADTWPSGFKHVKADGTRSTAAPSPALCSPSPPQSPTKPAPGAEGGGPRPWARSHGQAGRQGHPCRTTLGAKATFPPATALLALPSKPDFNSNVSSRVINKPCNLLLQRAGVPAASAGRNPNPPRHRGHEEAFRGQEAALDPLHKPETHLLLLISFQQIFPVRTVTFKQKHPPPALRQQTLWREAWRRSPFPGFPAHVHT